MGPSNGIIGIVEWKPKLCMSFPRRIENLLYLTFLFKIILIYLIFKLIETFLYFEFLFKEINYNLFLKVYL